MTHMYDSSTWWASPSLLPPPPRLPHPPHRRHPRRSLPGPCWGRGPLTAGMKAGCAQVPLYRPPLWRSLPFSLPLSPGLRSPASASPAAPPAASVSSSASSSCSWKSSPPQRRKQVQEEKRESHRRQNRRHSRNKTFWYVFEWCVMFICNFHWHFRCALLYNIIIFVHFKESMWLLSDENHAAENWMWFWLFPSERKGSHFPLLFQRNKKNCSQAT